MRKVLALGMMAIVGLPLAARADVLTGTLNATGTADISLGNISFLNNEIDFNKPAAAQVGGFTAVAGTQGTIKNISAAQVPTNTPVNIPLFVTFNSAPNLSFTLNLLLAGIDGAAGCSATPPAAGQMCTPNVPAQSPFNLQNTSATTSSASFNIQGVEVDSSTGQSVAVSGTFTTPFTTQNFQQILATVVGGGTVVTAFSAQFATNGPVGPGTAPEPGTWIELAAGIGLVGMSSIYRKKFKKQ